MNTLIKFHFVDTDGMGTDIDILVLTHEVSNDLRDEIEDAISSYINSVEDWQYEELINEIFSSFDLDYEIINPITYNI